MPPMSQKMRSGAPKLSDQAKHLVVPEDIVSTGWPAVRKTCVDKLGAEFDPWQDGAGRVILAKRADGNLASMIDGVGMSLPRQVGKTHLIGYMVFALCVNMPGLLVIWTAHHSATSTETFLSMQGFAKRGKIVPHVKQVFTGSGDEEVRFHNGSRILFGAREHGFGRGIAGVDVLIFDEAQILSDKAMSNMLATMNTSKFGLQLYIGTPPKPEDRSETFKRMRREAIGGTLVDGAWIEFGADADADGDDRAQWRKMNPSYPKRTPVQSLQRLKRKLSPDDWRREGMGIWDDDQEGSRLISEDVWTRQGLAADAVERIRADEEVRTFGVTFSQDGKRVAVAGGLRHPDGAHGEIVDGYSGHLVQGVDALAVWLAEPARREKTGLYALSGRSHAEVLKRKLIALGVPKKAVHILNTTEYFTACSTYEEGLADKSVTHSADESANQSLLDQSVAVCDKKIRGAGSWGWEVTVPGGDETPVEAVSVAVWAALTTKRRPGRKVRAVVLG